MLLGGLLCRRMLGDWGWVALAVGSGRVSGYYRTLGLLGR